ncbi:MAG: Vitamin B12 transport ATP-binding protein BacA [Syntrophus sp. PtaB.Bin138]|nr:MAG: Vitamin B12 transport ATP-binding protein BacA [Syntrophus sp. PtaB.Bin138]
MNIFDRRLWKRFWQISRLYWCSDEKWRAWWGLVLLLLLLLGVTTLNVALSFVGRDFMTALAEKNISVFNRTLLIYLGVFIVATPVSVFFDFVSKTLGVNWRFWLTGHFLAKYFTNRAYYHINNDKDIDNPDQRIAQDISSFTVTSLAFLSIIFFSLVQLVSFAGILWSISVPLVLVLVTYATVGTGVTLFFGKRLINLNFLQLRREADFRYGLVHIRNNAESIAFYRGEDREKSQVRERLGEAIANFRMLIGWERNLGFFTKGYQYVILVLPIVVMAPQYFAGEIKFGVVTQATEAFSTVLGALSVIVAQFEKLSQFVASISRLETFAAALERDSGAELEQGGHEQSPVIASLEEPRLSLKRVTLHTPDYEKTLLKEVSAEVPPGGGLLIMGPSGVGKSSVLRAVAGLWTAGEGEISRPPLREMIFLPQRPYMVLGSLRDQLLYPSLDRDTTDEELRAALVSVNLADLPDRVGGFAAVLGWGQILSLGEQQRLAFARLLLTKSRYAVLDEATSALDVANEKMLYGLLQRAGVTFVSVGHRPSLLTYHDTVLELRDRGEWRFAPAAEYLVAVPS